MSGWCWCDAYPIEVCPVRETLALSAARIKAAHPISCADAFAVATAKSERARLATGLLPAKSGAP